jgi:hypothetical protein
MLLKSNSASPREPSCSEESDQICLSASLEILPACLANKFAMINQRLSSEVLRSKAYMKSSVQEKLQMGQIKGLFLGWQDPHSHLWLPIGKMTWNLAKTEYYFACTEGMRQAIEISPIQKMILGRNEKLFEIERSQSISYWFKSRMPIDRPNETRQHSEYLGLSTSAIDLAAFVSRTGGLKNGDSYDVFPDVYSDHGGNYCFYFIPWKLRADLVDNLELNSLLECHSGQIYFNDYLIGQLPGYINDLLVAHPNEVEISVAKVNLESTIKSYRLLCCAKTKIKPFSQSSYQPLVELPNEYQVPCLPSR